MGSYNDNDRVTSNGLEYFASKLWGKIKNNFLGKSDKAASAGNADTVNGKTVEADVPKDAVFTDTTYTGVNSIRVSSDNVITIGVDDKNFIDDIDGDTLLHLNFGNSRYQTLEELANDVKTKQSTVGESGSTTQTITNIYQNENGEISVDFDDIEFDGIVPNLEVSAEKIDGGTEVTITTMKGSETEETSFTVNDGDDGNTIIKYSDTVFMYDDRQPVFTDLKTDNSKIGDLVVWCDDDGTYISQIVEYKSYGGGSSQIAYGDAKTLISGAEGKSIRNIGVQGLVSFDDDTKTSGSIASGIFENIDVGETIVFNFSKNEYIATVTSITENERYGFTAVFNNCSCISGNSSGTYVPFEYNPSVIGRDSPAADCKTYWENMENGVKIVYNNQGTEYTLIFSKQGQWGTILRYSYNSFYFEVLQKTNEGWKQEDWDKMDADIANKVNHSLSIGGKTFNGSADVSVSFRDIMPTNANYDFQINNQCIHMFTTRSIIADRKDKFGTFMYTFRNSINTPRYGIVNLYWDSSASQMRLSDYVYGKSDSSSGAIFFIRKNSDNTYNVYCKTTDQHAYLSYALVTCAWAADIHNSVTTDTADLVPETIVSDSDLWNGYKLIVGTIPPTSEMAPNTIYLG